MAVNRILVDFAGWTSAHGIPHIGSAQNNCLRVFWTVIFIASTSMFIFQMVLLIKKYTSYDVTVQTELKFEEREFPSVTMCNLNPYRFKAIENNDLITLMKEYNLAIKNSGNPIAAAAGDKWGLARLDDTIAIQSEAREHLLFIAGNMTWDKRTAMSYELADPGDFESGFVLNCAFNTRPCRVNMSNSDFETIDDPIYGKCYTFNYNASYKSTRAGPLYGLRLLAVSNQMAYLPLTESAGVRVAVHGHDEEPFPDAFGYNAAAGFTTSFGIKFIKTKRLPEPYGNCTDDRKKTAYYYDGTYQVEGCFRSCFQENIFKRCGCNDPRFKMGDATKEWSCAPTGKERECVDSFNSDDPSNDNQFNVVEDCSCPQPCTESTYGVTVSTALWPSDVYTPPECRVDLPGVPWANKSSTTGTACTDWYKENTMLIEVYYERMNYQLLSESEAYTMVNLISDMGGQLGLWMGISVITVVEFISLGILLCLYCINRPKDDQVEDLDDKDDVNAFDGTQFGGAAK